MKTEKCAVCGRIPGVYTQGKLFQMYCIWTDLDREASDQNRPFHFLQTDFCTDEEEVVEEWNKLQVTEPKKAPEVGAITQPDGER